MASRKRDKIHFILAGKPICGTRYYRLSTKDTDELTCGNCKRLAPQAFEYKPYKGWKIEDAPGWMFKATKNVSIKPSENEIVACTIEQLKTMINTREKRRTPTITKGVEMMTWGNN